MGIVRQGISVITTHDSNAARPRHHDDIATNGWWGRSRRHALQDVYPPP